MFYLGQLSAGTATNFSVTLSSLASGTLINQISVGADQTDVNPADNTAQSTFTVGTAPSLSAKPSAPGVHPFALTLSVTGPTGVYDILATTNLTLTNWSLVSVVTNTSGTFQFTDTNTTGYSKRYYRALYNP